MKNPNQLGQGRPGSFGDVGGRSGLVAGVGVHMSQAQSAPPGARAGQAAGKKVQTEQAAAFGSTLQISYQELPPGIRGRFTEIFVDEAGECIP